MLTQARKLYLLGAVAIFALVIAGYSLYQYTRASSPELYGTVLENLHLVEPFELTDVNGDRVTLERWRGKLVLAFFGFVNCPDVCPMTMSRLASIYEELGEPEDVQVVMITVDPDNDTPERLQGYVSAFHPDFVGLSGDSTDIANAARNFFVAYRELEDNQFMHTDTVALLDRDGKMRLVYGQHKVAGIGEDLAALLASGRW